MLLNTAIFEIEDGGLKATLKLAQLPFEITLNSPELFLEVDILPSDI
ncbi:MAG: hypothetical protein IPP49_00420 [Saprospiraceae bacterium]|nr:hypothetical protein [Saprospiraceae bacterium]